MLAWAGPIAADIELDTSILHLAPVARETPSSWRGRADFVGLTAQGLVRAWAGEGAEISQVPLAPVLLPERCDAIVISEVELDSCAALTDGAATVAVTAQSAPTTIHLPGGEVAHVRVPALGVIRDDVGAGDVFAAAFFVALSAGRPAQAAAAFANAAAAVRIAGCGADAIGDRPAVEARLRAGV
jgi:sugar/nucleoside kinase (ribokinase family)